MEDFIAQNNQIKSLGISQKEVWQNPDNQKEFVEKAKICKLDLSNLGVPTLWVAADSKCYVGDQPIIDYLNQLTAPAQSQK